jgi:hypothetical protein
VRLGPNHHGGHTTRGAIWSTTRSVSSPAPDSYAAPTGWCAGSASQSWIVEASVASSTPVTPRAFHGARWSEMVVQDRGRLLIDIDARLSMRRHVVGGCDLG